MIQSKSFGFFNSPNSVLVIKRSILQISWRDPVNPAAIGIQDDVIKWKLSPRYWPSVRGIHRPPVNSLHKGQWRGALMFPLICTWINAWVNNSEVGDLRLRRDHYDVIVMKTSSPILQLPAPNDTRGLQVRLNKETYKVVSLGPVQYSSSL